MGGTELRIRKRERRILQLEQLSESPRILKKIQILRGEIDEFRATLTGPDASFQAEAAALLSENTPPPSPQSPGSELPPAPQGTPPPAATQPAEPITSDEFWRLSTGVREEHFDDT